MALENSLREISEGLRSTRVGDRKKNAEKLKEFLGRTVVPTLLTENTMKRRGYSWNDMFDDINDYVIKETEKFETSKTFGNVAAPLCTSLLHLCVAGSNKGKAFIKCEKITDACLLILKDSRLQRAIGDAYLNLLYKHVLPQKYYLGFIAPQTWEDILDVSLNACATNYSKLDDYAKLRLVLLIMKSAKSYCQFAVALRDVLPKWKQCFNKVANDKKVHEVVVEIIILFMESLSVECRLSLCHFMEGALSSILKFYDQNLDQKKKSLLFQLLYYNVTLHHPEGRHQTQEGSFAYEWDVWNKQLQNILEVVCLEISVIQKHRKPNDDLLKQTTNFSRLAAAVYFQIFFLAEALENDVENTSKRQKICFNKNRTFTDIIDELQQNYIPWLGIVHMYVKYNGIFISNENYCTLISVVQKLVTCNIQNWDIIEELSCTVLRNITPTYVKDEGEKIIISLWDYCVRNSTTTSVAAQQAIHNILRCLLSIDILSYDNAQSLFKTYTEKGMPVTSNSVTTLSNLFYKFYSKYSSDEIRSKCFTWMVQGDITSLDIECIKDIIMRLLSKHNFYTNNETVKQSNLYDILFNSNEKCLLFSEFELDIEKSTVNEQKLELTEIHRECLTQITDYFNDKTLESVGKLQNKLISLPEYTKLINIVVVFLDATLKFSVRDESEMRKTELVRLTQRALRLMYVTIEAKLNSEDQISHKIHVLRMLKDLFLTETGSYLSTEVRSCVHKEFFLSINKILLLETKTDDEEKEINMTTLKHNSVLVLASYCRKNADYKNDLLKHILDPKIYDFTIDGPCLFECIELLIDANVKDPPTDLIFTLMQFWCREMYRDPEASYILLQNLCKMLETVWSSEGPMKQNCLIMIKSFLSRCDRLYYPPQVAGLIYKTVAKIAKLNREHNFETESSFENALMAKIKGEIHLLRIYCCYLLKMFISECSQDDTELFLSELVDIFVIDVSNGHELVIKDESANRTLTLLHCCLTLVQTKTIYIHKVVYEILKLQKDKSLDEHLVKKVFHKIVHAVGITNTVKFVDKHIVSILFSWLSKNNSIEELPVRLLGYENLEMFITQYKEWIIPADILWRKGGEVQNNCIRTSSQSVEDIIESCFANIIVLCLPYIVTKKYALTYRGSESCTEFEKFIESAQKMYKHTGQILEKKMFNDLFIKNIGQLVLMAAAQLCDRSEAIQMFEVVLPAATRPYCFPKVVFTAILDYLKDLTSRNIMEYLCNNQPLTVFQVLFTLWKSVIEEQVTEFKVMAIHAFLTFVSSVPLGLKSDDFICNYVCRSFCHAIKKCRNSKEMQALVKGIKIFLDKVLPEKYFILKDSISQLISVLAVQKDEMFQEQCETLLCYLKENQRMDADVLDFISSLAQTETVSDSESCCNVTSFKENLQMQLSRLTCPSSEILLRLHQILRNNKVHVKNLYRRISTKGFSEDCGSSLVHQTVSALCNILKSTYYDDKIVIIACDCLSEIGAYDLKTLVTVPPLETHIFVDKNPKHNMACTVLKSLSGIMFDEDPTVTKKVLETMNNLLKQQEGKDALDLEHVDKNILAPLVSLKYNKFGDFKIIRAKFDQYCTECFDGVFLKSLTCNWDPNDTYNYRKWLKQVTTSLLRLLESPSNYFYNLIEVCDVKPTICQKILPALVGLILHCSTAIHVETFARQINNFFTYIWETFDDRTESISDSSNMYHRPSSALNVGQKIVIQYMLDVVDLMRSQRSYYTKQSGRTVESLNYLRLDYDKVAWAASVADQHFAAIYYGELWALEQNNGVPPTAPEVMTSLPRGSIIQHIFRKCYVSIGEMDAIEGCGTAHLTIENEKRKHLINTGQYTDSLLLHDIALSCGNQLDHELNCGAVRSLHKSGMHHLALQYIKSLPDNDQLNDIKYECLSFLGDWSEIVDTTALEEKAKQSKFNPYSVTKAFHYACLKDCLNIQTIDFENKLVLPLHRAKLAVSRLCQNLNMENCQSVYKVVAKLHLFTDIEDYFTVRANKLSTQELLTKWEVDNLPIFQDFKHLEPLISQRALMLEHAKLSSNFKDEIMALQIQYAKLGLTNNRIQMAQRILAIVKKSEYSEEVTLVESEIAWARGHKEIALSLLRNIVFNQTLDRQLTARSLRQYASWMAESKRDNAQDIIEKYLFKSLKVLEDNDHVETRLRVYSDIAQFADAEYKQVVSYMNSSEFQNKVKCMENLGATATSLRSTQNLTRAEQRALIVNEKLKIFEQEEIEKTRAARDIFLQLAMRYYLLSLEHCEENNLSIFRVISLWLNNPTFQFDESFECTFENLLLDIPSRKFITVLPQLAPRLSTEVNVLSENLKNIFRRCAFEHPHHTLPILFGLKNAEKDKIITSAGGHYHQEPKTIVAEVIVKELASANIAMSAIVAQMEKICDATISLANYDPPTKEHKQNIPQVEPLHKLRRLDAIPIPTVGIPIRNDCKYTDFPTLNSFENYFEFVGGVNYPKKVSCTDSRGEKRILLIKGKDDMRQDAMVQQVFTIVNTLLKNNHVTNRNKLLIRTYKVVPMSKQSGVLEWCRGTIPVGVYLAGSGTSGAHARYRPQDMTCAAARKKIDDYHVARKSPKEKLHIFTSILEQFKPVFHYFFTEHYLDPVTWYERRLAYTKSVAASSMVGYILGLGDRHVKNILIDKITAEVVHIDFGIALEHGKTLNTPETVPFRLTQDFVAGFGSCGVEGIFRGCCEKTMQLLRDNSEMLLTILEVLLCDPLQTWTVTNTQNVSGNRDTRVQGTSGGNSVLAERALLAVRSKLSGTEGGAAGGMAVPGQVARLLQQATDPSNLCRLYSGWQAYL